MRKNIITRSNGSEPIQSAMESWMHAWSGSAHVQSPIEFPHGGAGAVGLTHEATYVWHTQWGKEERVSKEDELLICSMTGQSKQMKRHMFGMFSEGRKRELASKTSSLFIVWQVGANRW
jgi:hypothetical protein